MLGRWPQLPVPNLFPSSCCNTSWVVWGLQRSSGTILGWRGPGQLSSHAGAGWSRPMCEEPVQTVMAVLRICLQFLLVLFCWPRSDFVGPPLLLPLLIFISSCLWTRSPQSNASLSPGSSVRSSLHTPGLPELCTYTTRPLKLASFPGVINPRSVFPPCNLKSSVSLLKLKQTTNTGSP